MPTTKLEWVKPPRQARSQRTLERILDAAEVLIAERGADNITVAEVARRANSSVGSLYGRFRGKEALERSVFERFIEQAGATVESALDSKRWRGAPLFSILQATIGFAVEVFHERKPLIAALTLRAATDPEVAAIAERLGTTIAEQLVRLADERAGEIKHPSVDTAVHFCTWIVLSALEANALRTPSVSASASVRATARTIELTRAQLSAECTNMCCRYLGIDTAPIAISERAARSVRASMR